MKSPLILFIGISCLFVSLGACLSLQKSFLEKRYYILDVSHESAVPTSALAHSLRIRKLQVSPRFEGKGLVYRRGHLTYESDFYNEFLIPPGSLMTEELRQWLVRSGLFEYVTNAAGQVEPTYILEGTVSSLYGDYRDGAAPQAVLEIEFFLVHDLPAREEILLRKGYREEVTLKGTSPESLVEGWNNALQQIFTALENDLRRINFKKAT